MGYIGFNNPLILTIDPNFQRDIQVGFPSENFPSFFSLNEFHSAVLDPEIKPVKLLIFPAEHVIPESSKFSHWLSEKLGLKVNITTSRK